MDTAGNAARVTGGGIDLQSCLRNWHSVYAVREFGQDGVRDSLQILGPDGAIVHTILLNGQSDQDAFLALVDLYCYRDEARPQHKADRQTCTDGGAPVRSTVLASAKAAWPVDFSLFYELLDIIVDNDLTVSGSTGNTGGVQTFTGPLYSVEWESDVIKAHSPDFNLEVHVQGIASTWLEAQTTHASKAVFALCGHDSERLLSLCGTEQDSSWDRLISAIPRTNASRAGSCESCRNKCDGGKDGRGRASVRLRNQLVPSPGDVSG